MGKEIFWAWPDFFGKILIGPKGRQGRKECSSSFVRPLADYIFFWPLAWDKCSFTGFTFRCASSTCDLNHVLRSTEWLSRIKEAKLYALNVQQLNSQDSTFDCDFSNSDGIIGPGHLLLDETGPGRTCYQLTQPLIAIAALMHSYVEYALPSPFHRDVLKEPFT
jgi:hypothetical protein